MWMALDDCIYCSPLPGVLSLDRLLQERDESGRRRDIPARTPNVDTLIDAERALVTLHDHIRRLPTRQRQVVERHFLAGLTLTRVASDLGVSITAVSKLKAKALGHLRSTLTPHRGELLA
jgi:RNA polymerase sigma factor for flagellar operon FliA